MNSKNITILAVTIVLTVSGIAFLLLKPGSPVDAPANADIPLTPISTEQVAQHNNKTDCWTIINGSVYDITSYVPRHPGGDEILRACGTDGTTLFTQRETTDGETVGSGSPHSRNAESQLEKLKIADLAQ